MPSLLNFYWRSPDPVRWERFLRYIIRLHGETVGPFTRRPITTALLHQAYLYLHDAWLAFLSVQGTLLAASALALGYLAKREDGLRAGILSILIYFLSFTVLFSFVTPNDAFDEPAQYLFLFLTLYFAREKLPLGFACAFLLALLSRETSLLLLPGIWLLDQSEGSRARKILKYAVPIAAWAAFYFWKDAAGDPGRYGYWVKNFSSTGIAFETVVSAALALSLPAAIFFSGATNGERAGWKRGFLLALAVNTPIVLFAAYARESRLLALPLVFLWPRAGGALLSFRPSGRNAGTIAVIGIAGGALLWFAYHPHYRHVLGYRLYACLLPLIWAIAFAQHRTSATRRSVFWPK